MQDTKIDKAQCSQFWPIFRQAVHDDDYYFKQFNLFKNAADKTSKHDYMMQLL